MELTVAEANQQDVGRTVARLPSHILEKQDLVPGDIIKIKGKKQAVATALRSKQQDRGLDIIRIDGTTRYNADTSLGEKVTIQKADYQEAKKIEIAPLQDIKFTSDPTQYFKQKLLQKPFKKGQKILINIMGRHLKYIVKNTTPKGIVKITNQTTLAVSEETASEKNIQMPDISYEDIGGLNDEIELVRELVEIPMKHPEVFERLGIEPPKGILLTGPPGTGKTLLAKAVASESEAEFYSINGPEIMSKYYGESEKKLREVFEQAEENSPSVIFIDEIDSIAPKRGESKDQTEKRVVSQLLTLMDGVRGRGNIVVIAATNLKDDIDPALRRPGRFDREISIRPPQQKGRNEILQIHTRGMPLAEDVDLEKISERTIGYTGADIEVLTKEAAMKAIRPYLADLREFHEKVPTNVLEKMKVKQQDFDKALQKVEPSAMREFLFNKPKTTWKDIGGLKQAKQKLTELVELPITQPEYFKKAGIQPPKGVLLYGPPGTGKTLLAKAVANESNANFISVKGPEIIDKYVGESEKAIREIFKKARQVAPSIIFFDEFDSISKVRGSSMTDSTERIVNQLLTELDGVEELQQVSIIAATNRKDLVDPALLRPGRIDSHIEITPPDKEARKQILRVHTKTMPLTKQTNIEAITDKTEGWTGADLASLTKEAGLTAIQRTIQNNKDINSLTITQEDIDTAYKTIQKKRGKSDDTNN